RARTGHVDVNSYESEGPATDAPIHAAIHALHEAHIRVDERVVLDLSRRPRPPGDHAADVRETDEAIEVGDGDRLRIDRVDGRGRKHMKRAAKGGATARNRDGVTRSRCLSKRRSHDPVAEGGAGNEGTGSGVDEGAA